MFRKFSVAAVLLALLITHEVSAQAVVVAAPMIAIVDIGTGGGGLPDSGAPGIKQCPGRLITGQGC